MYKCSKFLDSGGKLPEKITGTQPGDVAFIAIILNQININVLSKMANRQRVVLSPLVFVYNLCTKQFLNIN